MAAHVVGNHRVGNPLLEKFPRGEAGPLIAGPSFIYPHVYLDAQLLGLVDGRRGRAVVHKGQPARVAVGHDVDRFPLLAAGNFFDNLDPMLADAPAEFRILVRDGLGGHACDADGFL